MAIYEQKMVINRLFVYLSRFSNLLVLQFVHKKTMASSKDYLIYVLELLREVRGITYKYMMSEYILYKDNIIFGGIYDNRFLVKKTKSVLEEGLKEQIPYPSAKPMLVVDSEDPDYIKELVLKVCVDLINK